MKLEIGDWRPVVTGDFTRIKDLMTVIETEDLKILDKI